MTISVRPATDFDDVKTLLGPKRPDANVCWCLTYRLSSKENAALAGPERGDRVATLMEDEGSLGVLAYEGDRVVGWAAVAPRARTAFARSRTIPQVDDRDAWAVWCIRVRPGHRGKGISHHLLEGAVAFARSQGATVLEGYPVDNGIGMTADQLPQVFDIFMRADTEPERTTKGLGIGLALARHLVEQHGGTIEARSDGIGK